MLPGTAVYAYAGSSVPSLQQSADKGVNAVFSRGQLAQIITALALLGLFPLAVRWIGKWISRKKTERSQPASNSLSVHDEPAT